MTGLILPAHVAEARARIKATQERIEHVLQKAYPNHLFQVEVTPDGDCFIDHYLLRHAKGRYYFHVKQFLENEQVAVRQAGELLERVELPRAGLQHLAQYSEADNAAKTAYKAR